MARFTDEALRKIYERIKGDSGYLIMDEEELRSAMAGYPDGTLASTARALGLTNYREEESNQVTTPTNDKPKVAKAASGTTDAGLIELKKFVDKEIEGVRRALGASATSNGKALTQAINNRKEVQNLAERVDNSIANMEKMLPARLDAIANTVVGYMASGGSQNGKVEPLQIHIHLPEGKSNVLEGMHTRWNFEKWLRLGSAGINISLTGPKGSGKSTMAWMLAEAWGLPFYRTDLSGGASESMLTCKITGLDQRPIASEFLCGYGGIKNVLRPDGLVWPEFDEAAGGVCCLEEMDIPDATVLPILNGPLGDIGVNRSAFLTSTHFAAIGLPAKIYRHKRNLVIGCMNTFGTGMDMQYAGRQAQDAAFMDRFYMTYLDYDDVLEAKIANLPIPLNRPMWQAAPEPTLQEWQSLAQWVLGVRDIIKAAGVRIDWGTRALLKAKAARYAGIPSGEVQSDLLLGLPADVIDKAMKVALKSPIGPGAALGAHLGAHHGI